jgi:RNA polymerase sigma-70 factor (ECF subfamily)
MRGEGEPIEETDPGAGAAGFEAALPHLDAAWTLARYLLRDDHDAQDAVQEAYLRALRRFGERRGGDLRAWLLRIVRNVCMDVHRGRARSPAADVDEMEIAGGEPADAGLLRAADEDAVRAAIERLPPEFREVIVLREFEEMSYKRIAAVTGVPAGTVMSRLARARALLRRYLADER